MTQGSTPRDVFRQFAADILPQGTSANAIIQAASDAGFGISRGDALGIIRELRQSSAQPLPIPFEAPQIVPETGAPVFRWGEMVQETDQWAQLEGPNAIMFQQLGPNADEWLDYIVLPEEEDFIGYRLVIEDDEYVDQSGRASGYRTSQSFDASIPLADAISRLGLQESDVARVIFDKP